MEKIKKILAKMSEKERSVCKTLLIRIKKNQLSGLDVKKLKGRNDIYRVRKGKVRVIYRVIGEKTKVLRLEKRNDNTYR